ncbi:MAG: PBP1A family penicillin-binding protein [Candidatus Glassbacteria bacterium]|nr:PBP1A family penicillin-binding protein [Candidatus Glassbacteria bacterium]
MKTLYKLIKSLFYLGVITAVLGFCAGVAVAIIVGRDIPQLPDELEKLVLNTRTEFYSSTGKLIATMGEKNRVPLSRISPHFRHALLAAEDYDFYKHAGISKTGILRAIWTNIRAGRVEGGASTLTQQLSRNFFFSLAQTSSRKIKEILLAFQLEYMFEKDEILEAYCNNMYFGSGAYGIEAASRVYFAKHADQLTVAEAALMVAVLNGPSLYNPYAHPGRARNRQLWILGRMEALGLISGPERLAAEQEELRLKHYTEAEARSNYFLDYVKGTITRQFGEQFLYYGGLKIYTTIDQRMQSAAVAAMAGNLRQLDGLFGLPDYAARSDRAANGDYPQGALVAVESGTGAILAMVGGRNYQDSQFNRAESSNRLPGSAFKPFVYYTAMQETGLSPASTLVDSAVTYELPNGQTWSPNNFEMDFAGRITIKKALEKSRNVIAAQLITMAGPERVAETARRFGITSPIMPTPSLALGTSGVSPVEMAGAFSVLATGGVYYEPYAIKRIEDTRGNVLLDPIPRGREVANPQLVYQVVDMMQGVMDRGTGAVIRRMGFTRPAAGKTGTTSNYRDSWFVGFTPGISTACWVGFDDNREMRYDDNGYMRGLTGSRGAAPMWGMFMLKATEGAAGLDFSVPPGIDFLEVDAFSGLPPSPSTPPGELIRAALLPAQVDAVLQKAGRTGDNSPQPQFDPLDF